MNYKPKDKKEKDLIKAFSIVSSEKDTANFLRDLLTPQEIQEFSTRLEIAKLLNSKNLSYRDIAKKAGVSTTTVSRVALWLNEGSDGYKQVLKAL